VPLRIFLTGGTGYLGGALARRLVAEGHEVRALVRAGSHRDELERLGATLFVGDIGDRYSLREGMSGADWVIHAAAHVVLDGDAEAMAQANVEGSENVASLAYKLGVGRFLSISSVAAFGGSSADGTPATEATPAQPTFPSPYSATKHAGQQRIAEWARRGLKVNTVYPSLIYGPPGKKVGANPLLRRILRGQLPVVVAADRKVSWVYLDDVVEALVRILDRAPAGRDYLLAGEIVTIRQLFDVVCRLGKVRPPRLSLPLGAVRLAAGLTQPCYRWFGGRPPFAPGELESLSRHWAFDDTRARTELGWQPRPLAEGLPPTIDFLTRQGR
jgi:dihydroflavonol-4-reductase